MTAGGNDAQVQGIGFTIDNPDDLQKQAREDADRRRAREGGDAREGGRRELGDPITISESNVVAPIPLRRRRGVGRGDAAAPATPIEPGTLDVTVTSPSPGRIK